MNSNKNTGAGKGSSPRNCFSKSFRDNYEAINWSKSCNYCNNTGYINNPKTECQVCKGKSKNVNLV